MGKKVNTISINGRDFQLVEVRSFYCYDCGLAHPIYRVRAYRTERTSSFTFRIPYDSFYCTAAGRFFSTYELGRDNEVLYRQMVGLPIEKSEYG